MKSILLTALLLSATVAAAETVMKPAARLNHLSRVLRGHSPSTDERRALQSAVTEGREEAFLAAKTDEYLASEAHAFKMNARLEELFRLQTNGTPLSPVLDPTNPPEAPGYGKSNFTLYGHVNSMNHLFHEIARKNLSWDTLLTGKHYRAFDISAFRGFALTDYGFLAALVPDLKSAMGTYADVPFAPETGPIVYTDVSFAPNDPRVAGALTTARFFYRFANTGLNKNRRRAAVIFRVFLCDSMSAAIPSSEGKEGAILDLMFPHDNRMTEEQIREMAQGDGHGQRPDCMACHYKLDPMGRTMMTSPLTLSPLASPGRLTYRTSARSVDVPVRGIGELGAAIARQPEYLSCQVRHFWRWFMDERVPLSPAREDQLIREFERVGRRTNDFVRIMLNQPEFYRISAPLTESEIRAQRVKTFLRKCQDCHKDQFYDGNDDGKFPDFTSWPIGGDEPEMKRWVRRIQRVMDLEHDGENPRMPPVEAPWRTTHSEVLLIKNWIRDGAPDESGRKQVTP